MLCYLLSFFPSPHQSFILYSCLHSLHVCCYAFTNWTRLMCVLNNLYRKEARKKCGLIFDSEKGQGKTTVNLCLSDKKVQNSMHNSFLKDTKGRGRSEESFLEGARYKMGLFNLIFFIVFSSFYDLLPYTYIYTCTRMYLCMRTII